MLKIEHLTKKYGEKTAVDDLSLTIEKGEIYGFIGHNGAGKTTTIKAVAGILAFDDGDIKIDGISVKEQPTECKRRIAYIPDNPDLYEFMTGIAYLNFVADIFGVSKSDRIQRIAKYSAAFEITKDLGGVISSYSHGMKQKLNIIGALIHEPKIWILDEPMTGLDPRSAYNLKQLMREHADKGNSVFFSSHVLEVVEKVCDRIGIIDEGHLITCCQIDELKERNKDKSLEELFLELTDNSAAQTVE